MTRLALLAASLCLLTPLAAGCGGGDESTDTGKAKVLKEGNAKPLDMAKFKQQFAESNTEFGELDCPPEVNGGVGAKFVCSFSSSDYGDGEVTVTQVSAREEIRTSIEGKLGKTVNTSFSYDAPAGSSGGELGKLTHSEGGFILEE